MKQNDGDAKHVLRRVLLTHAHHIGPHLALSKAKIGTQPVGDQTMPFTDIFQIFTHSRKSANTSYLYHPCFDVILSPFPGDDDYFSPSDFSYMIGHGACNANTFLYAQPRYRSYHNQYYEQYSLLLELGSPNAFSELDCDNVMAAAHK